MSEVAIKYKNNNIATMDASGTKTLQTNGKYCESDIQVVYARPASVGYVIQDASGYLQIPRTGAISNPTVTASTTDITDGVTPLKTGDMYVVYE